MHNKYSIRIRGDRRLLKGWELRLHKLTGLPCFIRGDRFIPVHEVTEFREDPEQMAQREDLGDRRFALVHAALRLWQSQTKHPQELMDIATNSGEFTCLSDEGIEDFIKEL